MGMHRLASLRHRERLFESQLTAELSNKKPDQEAMCFFEEQKARIHNLITEIEAPPVQVEPEERRRAWGAPATEIRVSV